MEIYSGFDIPIEALTSGDHEFSYSLDDAFFSAFEGDLIQAGSFKVLVEVEKVANHFNFHIEADGKATLECDRCLEPLALPVTTEYEFVLQYEGSASTDSEEEDVVYVPYGTERFNVAKSIYDAIGLSLPISKVHEDVGEECDPKMIEVLDSVRPGNQTNTEETEDLTIPDDSPWSVLRDLKSSEN